MAREPEPIPLDAAEILRALDVHDVAYVLIGSMAAIAHGAPYLTRDVDVTPRCDPANLARLAEALISLGAKLRVPDDPEPVEIQLDARTFAQMPTMTLRTRAGDLNLSFQPEGTAGYDDLIRRRVDITAFGVVVPVAHLDDVIRSKEAAGREKDRLVLPLLRRLQQRLAEEGREG